jgi:FkbM family methyltransferase
MYYEPSGPLGKEQDDFISCKSWFTLPRMANTIGKIPPRASRSFLEVRGRSAIVSAQLYFNKLIYGIIRSMCRMPSQGWLQSRWHWYRFPFSMRKTVLWSPFLAAWFSPEDESAMECMMRLPDYEPIGWVTPETDNVFVDIGAYIGPYTILAAQAVGAHGRVVAMEPDIANRQQLERNVVLNGLTNCTIIPNAAWSRSDRIGWHKGEQPVWHGVDESQISETVEAIRVDDMVAQQALIRVDWIKIDIEGGEIEALRGAANTLVRFGPTLFIEVHETMGVLRDLLTSQDYYIERESFDQGPDHHGWVLARPKNKPTRTE